MRLVVAVAVTIQIIQTLHVMMITAVYVFRIVHGAFNIPNLF